MEQFSREVAGITFDEIEAILKEGFAEGDSIVTISDTLRQKFEGWDQYRAPLIARTETISAMNKSDLESVKQLELEDLLRKHWLSSRDDNTRETHLMADKEYEAEGIEVGEEFKVGQDSMEAPGLGLLPEENINCFVSALTPILTDGGFKKVGKIQVGDKVLTHKGRFRKVRKVFKGRSYKGDVIYLWFGSKSNVNREIAVTPEHKFLVGNRWIEAQRVKVGDKLKILSTTCSNCGKIIPYYRRVCSFSCNGRAVTKKQWADPLKWEYFNLASLNHEQAFKFMGAPVVKVERRKLKRARRLYNFAVEEDESYTAKGLISHNCRCTVYYSQVEGEEEKIQAILLRQNKIEEKRKAKEEITRREEAHDQKDAERIKPIVEKLDELGRGLGSIGDKVFISLQSATEVLKSKIESDEKISLKSDPPAVPIEIKIESIPIDLNLTLKETQSKKKKLSVRRGEDGKMISAEIE